MKSQIMKDIDDCVRQDVGEAHFLEASRGIRNAKTDHDKDYWLEQMRSSMEWMGIEVNYGSNE